MIKRTLLFVPAIAVALTLSCASASAKQPATLEPIENLAPAGTTAPAITGSADESQGGDAVEGSASVAGGTVKRHLGAVLALARVPGTDYFLSGDAAGFVTRHDPASGDSWQVSDLSIRALAVHPDGNLVAVYESDGFTVHRVSVWNWAEKKRLYAKRFKDSVLSLSWSAKGTWLLVGNSSLEGMTALDGQTGNPMNLFSSPPGMVSFAVTGKTETSIMTFGPSGRLQYTDLSTGNARATYTGPSDLGQPCALGNNRLLAGLDSDGVTVIDATTGKVTASWYPPFPPTLLTASEADNAPYWFVKDPENGWTLAHGDAASLPFDFPKDGEPVSSLALDGRIILGASDGSIYSVEAGAAAGLEPVPVAIDSAPVRRIDDIASDGGRLFILTEGALLVSAGPGKSPLFAFDGIPGDRLALDGESLLFWSERVASPIVRASLDGDTRETLYVPAEPVTALNAANGKIAIIEGNAKVTVIPESGAGDAPFTYRGIGLQDIIALSGDAVIVSKSATARVPNPVVKIDTKTGETVPYKIAGNLCYGMKPSDPLATGFTGFLVEDGESGPVTNLVTVSGLGSGAVIAPPVKTVATYADEDLTASAVSDGDRVYTNLGKGSVIEIDSGRGKIRRFPRGYALPKRIVIMDRYVVSINRDGSVSWIRKNSGELESTSSITSSGYWQEE